MHQNKKNMRQLFLTLMKNIKFNYEEEKSNIKFEAYFFNGISIPNNIVIKKQTDSSVNLSWNIDDDQDINIDKEKIKYIVEMRKTNEKFEKIYEGSKTSYIIQNLNKSTNYELRICSMFNNLIGWSETKIINIFFNFILNIQPNKQFEDIKSELFKEIRKKVGNIDK